MHGAVELVEAVLRHRRGQGARIRPDSGSSTSAATERAAGSP